MPEQTSATPELQYIACEPTALFILIGKIVEHCVDPNLIERQVNMMEFHPEYAPIKNDVTVDFSVIDGQSTYIGNVDQIGVYSHIEAGAQIGDECIIKSRVVIGSNSVVEPFTMLEHGAKIENDVRVEHGAKLLTGSTCRIGSIIGRGAEVGYDLVVPPDTKIEPGKIANR